MLDLCFAMMLPCFGMAFDDITFHDAQPTFSDFLRYMSCGIPLGFGGFIGWQFGMKSTKVW
jgi:hypothetical protein